MKSLTKLPMGKRDMKDHSIFTWLFLGITPKGDTLKLSNGRRLNGPSTLPASTSLSSLLSTNSVIAKNIELSGPLSATTMREAH